MSAIIENDPSVSDAISKSLSKHLNPVQLAAALPKSVRPSLPTQAQLHMVALNAAVPFIGFGFIDNFIMLIAGEHIDTSIGVAFCTSTLFAAGVGTSSFLYPRAGCPP